MMTARYLQNEKLKVIITILLLILSVFLLFSLSFIKNPFSDHSYYGRKVDFSAPSFVLKNLEGEVVRLSDFQGKFSYLMFGYLNCTKVCHSQALVLDQLSNEVVADDVHFIYISMDPERDDVSKLKAYFKSKSDRLTILIGETVNEIQSIASAFKAPFSVSGKGVDSAYGINHPGYVFLIGPDGRLGIVYSASLIEVDWLSKDLLYYKTNFS